MARQRPRARVLGRCGWWVVLICCWMAWGEAGAQSWEKIVDDGDPGYAETGNAWADWRSSAAYGGDYRYLSHHNHTRVRKGTASWQITIPHTGQYEVSAHFRATTNRSTDADYSVTDGAGKRHHRSLDQKNLPSGWHKLGTFAWTQGQKAKVVLDGTDDTLSDEADAVRWRLVGHKPPNPVQPCQAQAPGSYTMTRYAGQVTAKGDWQGASRATGAPDQRFASSPNVDRGDELKASGFSFCTPPGAVTITGVQMGVLAKMQYDSGTYQLVMFLEGAGQKVKFSQKGLKWVYGELTKARSKWTIADLNALVLRTGLQSHPGGRRDSDAWVDAFSLKISYQSSCPNNTSYCSGKCVDLQGDASHCGQCGRACGKGERCQGGQCQLNCPVPQKECSGHCVDVQSDASHCGQCGRVCDKGESCQGGQCQPDLTCSAPRTLCSGRCVDLRSDVSHCGQCGRACDKGESCQGGQCQPLSSCLAPQQECDDRCVDVQSDASHCGECGRSCGRGEMCQSGVCRPGACPNNQQNCEGRCVDIRSDRAHCGQCGRACAGEESCVAGQCQRQGHCQKGQLLCHERCVHIQEDPRHCGACDNWCEPGEFCLQGVCLPVSPGNPQEPPLADGGGPDWRHLTHRQGCTCQNNPPGQGTGGAALLFLLLLALPWRRTDLP